MDVKPRCNYNREGKICNGFSTSVSFGFEKKENQIQLVKITSIEDYHLLREWRVWYVAQ